MSKILFVCRGNVCRSQMAEGYYNHFTNSRNAVSAGLSKNTPIFYRHPAKKIITAMKEESIDISGARVKTLKMEMLDSASRIYVRCPKTECPNFLANSKKTEFWNIPDPFRLPMKEVRKVRDLIKKRVLSVLNTFSNNQKINQKKE